ncbi:hypothetical protein [Planotetraspora sp. GP83]|uniref:hypothetical protein n=1 Tax=Planotetraspora sp. GP83 TaxID=3156264 RepID=UPI003512794C
MALPSPHDLGRAPAPDLSAPPRLRPILEELLSGVPDTTASRRLNMSARTYSRRVAELLDYLGVDTRFQAGVEIVRRRWVAAAAGPVSHRTTPLRTAQPPDHMPFR